MTSNSQNRKEPAHESSNRDDPACFPVPNECGRVPGYRIADRQRSSAGAIGGSERTLLLIAALGGSLGSLLGMYLFHHKTRHPKFTVGIPLILVLQIFLAWICFR
ncbi:MAG: DUF1294 domain-containing protein [Oscillospiraceae bacterium]